MKQFFTAVLFTLTAAPFCWGQHSDIEFGFDDFMNPSEIEVEAEEFNVDGVAITEGEFVELFLGGVNDASTDNPGFITPNTADEPLRFNPDDQVSVRFLDAGNIAGNTIGEGFVNFFDPDNAAAGLQALGALEISNSSGDTITLDGTNFSGSDSIFLSEASDGSDFSVPPPSLGEAPELLGEGEVHSHLVFDLLNEDSTPDGALGILAQFEVTQASDGSLIESNPFFIVFNNGLDDIPFEEALPAFLGTAAVPEPTGGVVLMMALGGVAMRRRRQLTQ